MVFFLLNLTVHHYLRCSFLTLRRPHPPPSFFPSGPESALLVRLSLGHFFPFRAPPQTVMCSFLRYVKFSPLPRFGPRFLPATSFGKVLPFISPRSNKSDPGSLSWVFWSYIFYFSPIWFFLVPHSAPPLAVGGQGYRKIPPFLPKWTLGLVFKALKYTFLSHSLFAPQTSGQWLLSHPTPYLLGL